MRREPLSSFYCVSFYLPVIWFAGLFWGNPSGTPAIVSPELTGFMDLDYILHPHDLRSYLGAVGPWG